ncbi:MAG: DNA-binding protein [Clostridiales bacterium]|nr:DNA-binding protein [Clostridiales bacterium]
MSYNDRSTTNETTFREKDLEVSLLLDFYGELLSDSRRETAEMYYNDDLSLAEIAENIGITRQGVRDSIAKAKTQLYSFEEKLGLVNKMREIDSTLSDLIKRLEQIKDSLDASKRSEIDEIIKEAKTITI